MPRGGRRINAGRKPGVLNKSTIERRERARIAAENAARESGAEKQLATDVLENLMMNFKQKASFYDALCEEGLFRYYAQMTWQAAKELAPYQSPKLSAVAVGENRKVEVVVIGGLPRRREENPPAVDVTPEKPPGETLPVPRSD